MRTAAILPVKRFSRAKQRLGESISDPLRLELAAAMVRDVIASLTSTPRIEMTIVVTREPSIAEAVRDAGAILIEDATEESQSAAVSLGARCAAEAGMQRILSVPGDCPALDPAELDALLAGSPDHGRDREVVVIPDRHGTGTNGLLVCPPDAIAPSFGPGSCRRHLSLAQEAGLPCRIVRISSLLLDIDTGADLAVLRARLSRERVRAPRTRAVLADAEQRAWEASHSAA